MAKKKIKFLCTAFRDGFQSVFGCRVAFKDYAPALEAAREAGILWVEAGGGAMFQSAFFYQNDNAFEIMDRFRKIFGPEANLQTLGRGINVVGLDSQPRDIIDMHARLFKKHGITTIRNFDALNDPQNIIYSGESIVKAGLKHQMAITMMSLPPGCEGAHDPDFYENTLKTLLAAKIPFDSLCFKDATGSSVPSVVHETIKRARKLVPPEVLIEFHSHETAGAGIACYLAAIEAGADAVDVSLAPVSGGSCQPDLMTLWHVLRNSDYTLDIDYNKVITVENELKKGLENYFIPPEATKVDPMTPFSLMPGGALTANTQMLRKYGLLDKYAEIAMAMGEVIKKGGYATSVTPASQFYFQQAFNNITEGPWKKIVEGYGKMVLGYFGKTPHAPDPAVVEIASAQLGLKPTTENPLDVNDRNPKKGIKAATETLELNGLPVTDENIFIAAACGAQGVTFLKGEGKTDISYKKEPAAGAPEKRRPGSYDVTVNGFVHQVTLKEDGSLVVGDTPYKVAVAASGAAPSSSGAPAPAPAAGGKTVPVLAPTPGTVIKIMAPAGTKVKKGQPVFQVEVMKMESEIAAPADGTVTAVLTGVGQQVKAGQTLAEIG